MPPRCRSPQARTNVIGWFDSDSSSNSKLQLCILSGRGNVGMRLPVRPSTAHSLATPNLPDTRRWSVASLPSSSGYGTPRSGSALSVSLDKYSSTAAATV